MTNGYPLSAAIGRKNIMEASQEIFISSTFYTERVAFAATIKSIELYEKYRVWKKQIAYGKQIKKGGRNSHRNTVLRSLWGIDITGKRYKKQIGGVGLT